MTTNTQVCIYIYIYIEFCRYIYIYICACIPTRVIRLFRRCGSQGQAGSQGQFGHRAHLVEGMALAGHWTRVVHYTVLSPDVHQFVLLHTAYADLLCQALPRYPGDRAQLSSSRSRWPSSAMNLAKSLYSSHVFSHTYIKFCLFYAPCMCVGMCGNRFPWVLISIWLHSSLCPLPARTFSTQQDALIALF